MDKPRRQTGQATLQRPFWLTHKMQESPVTTALLVPLELLSYLIFIPPYKGTGKTNQQVKI